MDIYSFNNFDIFDNSIILPELCEEYKLILSGGGYKGYYDVGISYILDNHDIKNNIRGIIGTSAGALSAVYIACNIDLKTWKNTYYESKYAYQNGKSLFETIKYINERILPLNAHLLCNNYNVEIVATKISIYGLSTIIFKNFSSRNELLECILASICMPFIINSKFPFCQKINNEYFIDGAILLNTPIQKICEYNQLVIRNHYVKYALKNMFVPNDNNIDFLISTGANEFSDFIKGGKNNVFKIYEKNKVCKSVSKIKIALGIVSCVTILCSLTYIGKLNYKILLTYYVKNTQHI